MSIITYGTSATNLTSGGGAMQLVKTVLGVAAMGFLLGTGSGAVSTQPSERINVYGKIPGASTPENADADVSDLVTAEQHLANIKSSIGLQMSELATFFGVSRQSVHKWQAGSVVPGAEYMGSIRELSRVADALAVAGVRRPADLVRAKAFNGRSLLDLVQAGENYSEALVALVAESRIIDERYGATKLATSDLQRFSDWQSSVSVPYASDV